MNKALLLAPIAAAMLTGGCMSSGYSDRPSYASENAGGDWGYYDRSSYDRYGRYDWNNPDPRYGGYEADRYYTQNQRYRERRLTNDDRVYRGRDGRYYCRRSDGTTGLIIGGIAGAALGAMITEGDSRPLGAIIGGVGGAVAGSAIDSGSRSRDRDVRCR